MTSRIVIGRWCISSHWKKKTISHLFKREKKKKNKFSFFSPEVYFHWRVMIFLIITLAHMLDSLVRVTRRVSWDSKMSNHWKENEFFWFPMPKLSKKINERSKKTKKKSTKKSTFFQFFSTSLIFLIKKKGSFSSPNIGLLLVIFFNK